MTRPRDAGPYGHTRRWGRARRERQLRTSGQRWVVRRMQVKQGTEDSQTRLFFFFFFFLSPFELSF